MIQYLVNCVKSLFCEDNNNNNNNNENSLKIKIPRPESLNISRSFHRLPRCLFGEQKALTVLKDQLDCSVLKEDFVPFSNRYGKSLYLEFVPNKACTRPQNKCLTLKKFAKILAFKPVK